MENAPSGKKRKLGFQDSTQLFQLKTRRLAVVAAADSLDCEYSSYHCSENVAVSAVCSSLGSSKVEEIRKENIDEETGDSLDCAERSETSLLIEFQADSGELESTASPLESNPRRPSTAEKMPPQHELEQFFAAAEKNLQRKFIDMYNFDIAADEPQEGRYEWVRIQPKPS